MGPVHASRAPKDGIFYIDYIDSVMRQAAPRQGEKPYIPQQKPVCDSSHALQVTALVLLAGAERPHLPARSRTCCTRPRPGRAARRAPRARAAACALAGPPAAWGPAAGAGRRSPHRPAPRCARTRPARPPSQRSAAATPPPSAAQSSLLSVSQHGVVLYTALLVYVVAVDKVGAPRFEERVEHLQQITVQRVSRQTKVLSPVVWRTVNNKHMPEQCQRSRMSTLLVHARRTRAQRAPAGARCSRPACRKERWSAGTQAVQRALLKTVGTGRCAHIFRHRYSFWRCNSHAVTCSATASALCVDCSFMYCMQQS